MGQVLAPSCYAHYEIFCLRKGQLLWADITRNLTTTVGRNLILDNAFVSGVASPTWFVGLKGYGKSVVADTIASHATWSELTSFDEATRQAWTPNGAPSSASVSNSNSPALFTASSTFNLFGSFLVNQSTKGGSTGTLYGVADIEAFDISAITKANPAVVTATGHTFANDDTIRISGVGGMVEVNDINFTVANIATNTFELSGINSTGYTTYTAGGYASRYRRVEAGDIIGVRITLSLANA